MKMLGHNHTFDSIVRTDELCTYQASEENPDWYVALESTYRDSIPSPTHSKRPLVSTSPVTNPIFSLSCSQSDFPCRHLHSLKQTRRTDFTQQAKVTSFACGYSNKVEDFILKQFKENSAKGREIMEMAIQRVEQERLAFAAAAHAAFM